MNIRRMALAGVLVVVVAVVAIVGLSGGGDDSSSTGSKSGSGAALRMGTTNGLTDLNPFVTVSVNGLALMRQMYPYLAQYDLDLKAAPDFASSWDVTEGGKVWTFHTRPNAEWSDGKPLTANDAAWTFELIKRYASSATANLAGALAAVRSVETPDANTLVVTYDRPRPADSVLAGLTRIPILPEHAWSSYARGDGKALQTVPQSVMQVGGGPFRLKSFKEAQAAILERNAGYYGTKPTITGFGLQVFSSPEVQLNALESGQIDWIQAVPPQAVSTLEGNDGLEVAQAPSFNQCNISFNMKAAHTELQQVDVREAIVHGIDVPDLIKIVMNGVATPASSIIPMASEEWVNPELEAPTFDPDEANRILDELGYTKGGDGIRTANGHAMSYRVVYSAINPLQQAMVRRMGTSLREVGIELVPNPVTGAGYTAALREDDGKGFDTVVDCWTSGIDPEFILGFSRCDAIRTFSETNYCSKEFDDLYAAQSEAVDADERHEILSEMQSVIARDKPMVWLFSPNVAEAWSKKWTGFPVGPAGTLNQLTAQALLRVHPVEG